MIPEIERIRARLEADPMKVFRKTYDDVPSQDNEGYIPDRAGFKCGFAAAWNYLNPEDLRRLIAVVEVWGAALEEIEGHGKGMIYTAQIAGIHGAYKHRARTALSDARKILGSEQEGGAG